MRAVVYARTSTLDQAREEKVSIPTQIAWAKELCNDRGWEFVGEYIEPGVFGDTEPGDREAFSKLWNDAKNGLFDLVLIYHSSRLAREPDIGMRMCRVLGQRKIQVYFRNSPTEPVDPNTFTWGSNIGAIYMSSFSFIGDLGENVARSERVRDGFLGLAKRGKLVFAPFGYKKIPIFKQDESGRQRYDWYFEIDSTKATVVQRIFSSYAKQGGSLRQLMLALNKELVPSPSGKVGTEAWTATTIRNILKDPAYIGKVRWGRKLGGKYKQGKSHTGKQKREISPEDKWSVVDSTNHQGFIDPKLFNRVQEKLAIRGQIKGRAVSSNGLLTGLVVCGRCGRKAYFRVRTERGYERNYYHCSSYNTYGNCPRHVMSAPKLHDIVLAELQRLTSDPQSIQNLVSTTNLDQNGNLTSQLEALKKEHKDLVTRQERILIAYETGTLTLDEYGKAKERLDTQVTSSLKQIAKIEGILNDKDRAKESLRKFVSTLKDLRETLAKNDFQKTKDLVHRLISTVTVQGDSINISYRL